MEGIDSAGFAPWDETVWGTEKICGQCQSKGVDGSASSNGGQWPAHPDRLPRGAATGGVYAYRIGIQLETDFGRHVELGRGVSG